MNLPLFATHFLPVHLWNGVFFMAGVIFGTPCVGEGCETKAEPVFEIAGWAFVWSHLFASVSVICVSRSVFFV